MKHRGCRGEMIPHGTFRLKNGALRHLFQCEKCGRIYAYREESRGGKRVYINESERMLKICEECGTEFWGHPEAHTCCIGCATKRRIRLTEQRKAAEKEEIKERKKKPLKASNGGLSAICCNGVTVTCTSAKDATIMSDGEYDYYALVVWSEDYCAFRIRTVKNPQSKVRGISDGNTEFMDDWNSDDWEVIGNDYDNSELLEVKR